MLEHKDTDDKHEALRLSGTLHRHPGQVTDERFQNSTFFDARDIVQVKYEMLRRVEHDGWSITRAAKHFGFSRPTFYQAQAAFRADGLYGLVPQRRGHQLLVGR